ncbi:thioredoxin family protein [Ramlibacter tataouinensis]|uniref:Protein-disulfide reductase (Thioredoxin)-like protein n=1 Tax=Ramlibacter tataouinensis (strain ATCC BAA-407 / DSM 14655 / LMG 21543 / TTB310) TaxID=365046 RepID=F5XVM9_RAMTT|nr:thioredoxin family protein [Ramlibacter tataouinensis]AEG91605.1 protein-disulfide reductase (thioredoxin)-like protein [Ramlibacter tataouinensis TTB310]
MQSTRALAAPPPTDWQVICLCAQWCGTCREWRGAFEQAAAARPGMRFAWVDIEDEADALGDVDVETFPTLLVAQAGQARFFGPVLPSAAQVERLLASLQADAASGRPQPEAQALLQRLNDGVLPPP